MDTITYDISQTSPSGGNAGIRIKEITLIFETPDGKECSITIRDTQNKTVELKTKTYGSFSTILSDIVMICPLNTGLVSASANSNNKIIFFRNRRPDIIHDFTPSHDIQGKLGVPDNEFVRVNRGWYVNRTHVQQPHDHTITVEAMNPAGEMEKMVLKVSRNCWCNVNKQQ